MKKPPAPMLLSDYALDQCERMIEECRDQPVLEQTHNAGAWAAKAGAMWAAAFVLMQHARALQAERAA